MLLKHEQLGIYLSKEHSLIEVLICFPNRLSYRLVKDLLSVQKRGKSCLIIFPKKQKMKTQEQRYGLHGGNLLCLYEACSCA